MHSNPIQILKYNSYEERWYSSVSCQMTMHQWRCVRQVFLRYTSFVLYLCNIMDISLQKVMVNNSTKSSKTYSYLSLQIFNTKDHDMCPLEFQSWLGTTIKICRKKPVEENPALLLFNNWISNSSNKCRKAMNTSTDSFSLNTNVDKPSTPPQIHFHSENHTL